MQQLIDFATIARPTDPATSHQAAAEVAAKLGTLQQAFVNECWDTKPLTASEIAANCATCYGGLAESYRKRSKELVRRGLVLECPPRRCSITGKMATTYARP